MAIPDNELLKSLRDLPDAIARAIENGPLGRTLAQMQNPSGSVAGGSGGGGSSSKTAGPPWFQKALGAVSKAKEFLYGEQGQTGNLSRALAIAGPRENWAAKKATQDEGRRANAMRGMPPLPGASPSQTPPAWKPPPGADYAKAMDYWQSTTGAARIPPLEPPTKPAIPPAVTPPTMSAEMQEYARKIAEEAFDWMNPQRAMWEPGEAKKFGKPPLQPVERIGHNWMAGIGGESQSHEMATKEILDRLNKLIDVQEETKQAIEDAARTDNPDKESEQGGGSGGSGSHRVEKAIHKQTNTQTETTRKESSSAKAEKVLGTLAKLGEALA